MINYHVKSSVSDRIVAAEDISANDIDCILVLGCKVHDSGEPSHMLRDRLMRGVELYDLGVSSFQFDDPERGFSYRYDAYLDMRMDQDSTLTAHEIINTYSDKELANIFIKYGEEPFAFKIAQKICSARQVKAINTTFELVEVIKSALPQKILNEQVLGYATKAELEYKKLKISKCLI